MTDAPHLNPNPGAPLPHPFPAMVERHLGVLRRVALRLTGNTSDAGDLVQDTLERGLRHFHRYTPGTRERAWLLTLMKNRFLDQRRQARRSLPAPERPEELEEVLPHEGAPEPTWSRVTARDVEAALGQLREDLRTTYRLHSFDGRPYREIAAHLRIPESTVGTRILRARRQLRQILDRSPANVG